MIAFMSADSVDHSAWAETQAVDDERRRIERASRVGQLSIVRSRASSGRADNSGVYFNVESEGSKNLYFATTGRPVPSGDDGQAGADRVERRQERARRRHSLDADEAERRRDASRCRRPAPTSTFTQLTAVNDDVLAGQGARADRGDLVHVEGRSQDPGLDREAAGLRPDRRSIR